jgi:hypothetical protein
MKKWYIYEFINLMGTIEYVGESSNPIDRTAGHKYKKGRFNKRNDIFVNILDITFDSKKKAFDYQCKLQNEYGLLSDLDKYFLSRKDCSKAILAYDYKTKNYINEFCSISEASRQLNLKSIGNISLVLNGYRNHTGGYTFKYK